MSDVIGRITVPDPVLSTGGAGISGTQVFPLVTQYPFGQSVNQPVITHRFGTLDAKQEQRYYVGIGPRRFRFGRQVIRKSEVNQLRVFWELMQGPWAAFTYKVPNPDNTTTQVLVTFEQAPLSFAYLVNAAQTGLNLVEVISSAVEGPYSISWTCLRFPSSTLSTALLSEVQRIIPLIHIRVREAAVPDIYISDRRVTVGGQAYLPRLTGVGEPGSDTLISQDIKGSSDSVKLTLGNADRVMTALANDTDLKYASIDICLYHVNSGILLQLWKGIIQSYVSDGSANFPVSCSDGFFQIMNQYPERQVSRQCWKPYNNGTDCPWATEGASGAAVTAAGGDPASCDYYLESTNGCQIHGMAEYFGGQQADPQGVNIKDDSTGFLGFGRNSVNATSIISDTVWGLALQEIWCNSGYNALYAYMATPLMVDYRDESSFADSLAIVGAGPLGGYTQSQICTTADGYKYVVAPMVDGFTWQGFKVDGNLNITQNQTGMGLRQTLGDDPANPAYDYFSLGQGGSGSQVWQPNNYAAGVAVCEMRIVKPSGIQPSTPDQHKMTVPIDMGLWGWIWDQYGNRSAVPGLVNPFWIGVNMQLRALGLYGNPSTGTGPSSATQLATFVLSSLANGGGGAADIAALQVNPILGVGGTIVNYALTPAGIALTAPQILHNPDGSYSFAYWLPGSPPPPPPAGTGIQVTIPIAQALSLGYVSVTGIQGTETQFQFQGCISSQKPFRDWLTEVLNCCLGFYAWEFGALKLGCRYNASAVDAYTLGSMLFQSLRLSPIDAAYEHIVMSYADAAYQYQANTADYCDKSHAAYYGRSGSPLTTQKHSLGLSTLSQALRVIATQEREETGGVTTWEWRNGRVASWQTTLLGLGNEVGQVVSVTHPDIPGVRGVCNVSGATATWVSGDPWTYAGTANGDTELVDKVILIGGQQITITGVASNGSTITTSPAPPAGSGLSFQVITMCFRISRWTLNKDWSVQIEGQTVTRSMYDLDVGPKPMDVTPHPLPPALYRAAVAPAWAPYQIQAASNDALFPGEWTFDSAQYYPISTDGTYTALQEVTGKLPVNEFSNTGAGAPGIGSISVDVTGGSLPANTTLYVSLCAVDSAGLLSQPARTFVVGTGPSAGESITLNDITWPAVTGMASYVLFIGTQDDLICAQATGALTPTGGGTTYAPNSITFGGTVVRSTWALPSAAVAKIRIKTKAGINHGISGLAVDSVSTNTIICGEAIGATITSPATWVGRIISVTGRPSGSTPFASYTISAFHPATGAFTVSPDPTGVVQPGDAIVIRNAADASNTYPYTSITDSGIKNSTENSGAGLIPNSLVGCLIRVIGGTGRGTPPRTILSNTADSITWDLSMPLDATSVWITEGPTWQYQQDGGATDNASPLTAVSLAMPAANYTNQPVVIAGFTVDVNGVESPDGDAPIREDWIYGAGNTKNLAS